MTEVAEMSIIIQGIPFECGAPFKAGDILSDTQAKALNQTRAENLRNNFAKTVAEAKEKAGADGLPDTELDELKDKFEEYASKYEFAGSRQSRAPVDPVLRTAERLARNLIAAAAKGAKIEIKSQPEGWLEAKVKELLGKRPDIMEEAKQQVERSRALAALAIDIGPAEAAPVATAEPVAA